MSALTPEEVERLASIERRVDRIIATLRALRAASYRCTHRSAVGTLCAAPANEVDETYRPRCTEHAERLA